jgi:phosphopantothenoylcysteine decarboxylase/phosphopantothenate--cysteine ligase
LAAEAAARGARVTLVSGPVTLLAPNVDEVVSVRSAADMHQAVMARVEQADIVIMAAAVADYTMAAPNAGKLAKGDGPLTLTLARTRDILGDLGQLPSRRNRARPMLVGFAAETHDVVSHAQAKLERKGIDLIVANDVSLPGVGFDGETNAVTLVTSEGTEDVPLQSKRIIASRILDRIDALLGRSTAFTEITEQK